MESAKLGLTGLRQSRFLCGNAPKYGEEQRRMLYCSQGEGAAALRSGCQREPSPLTLFLCFPQIGGFDLFIFRQFFAGS